MRHILRNPSKVQMKLLKFHQDVRPGYWGTWTKRSPLSSISKGRNPFAQDSDMLNYEYNSEEEWAEDPEDAEDLGELLSEGEEPSEVDSEDGGWLAGDDEEIEMEEGYEAMDVDPSDPAASAATTKKKHLQPGLRKTAAAKPLVEIIKGPYFVHGDDASEDEQDEEAAREKEALRKYLAPFSIVFLRECASSFSGCRHMSADMASARSLQNQGTPASTPFSPSRRRPRPCLLQKLRLSMPTTAMHPNLQRLPSTPLQPRPDRSIRLTSLCSTRRCWPA